MVKTGYISFITATGGGFDGNGNPISPTKVSSDYIDCNIKVVTKEYRTLVDGQYQQAAYSCYVDADKIITSLPTVKEIQLLDNRFNALGTFQVHNIEYLELSKAVKIIIGNKPITE